MTGGLLIRHVVVDGELVDVRVAGGAVVAVERSLPGDRDDVVIDGEGHALLPGLHDHHIHLLATAAARSSVHVGPPDVTDRRGLADALAAGDRTAPDGRWLRAVGYHESVAGDLDRHALDALVPTRPLRLQHRSGTRWTLNSAALAAIDPAALDRTGVERDASGRPTGRIQRGDDWLRALLPDEPPPNLAPLGRQLTSFGVTGVTDATPYTRLDALDALAAAARNGALPQRIIVTGGPELAGAEAPDGLTWGPVKIIIDESGPPDFDALCDQIATGHRAGRSVAVHCVTRATLALAVAAWNTVGAGAGDRVEHGAVVPPDLAAELARLRLTVVTQPGFVAERGDQYLSDVDLDDQPFLYPCRSLIDHRVAVGGSTDAPYSSTNPWAAIAAATERTTRAGVVLGPGETVDRRRALALFTSAWTDPGGPPRRIAPGRPADLCLLDGPTPDDDTDLSAVRAPAIVVGGVVHTADD